ncbi:COG3415 family protein, partial [Paraburkholderia sediminicola]|uniref:hypothetical protein n=1 Tax=Paraburkholderia sediminicola TaxID=458836 RepID=UPI0038BB3CDE
RKLGMSQTSAWDIKRQLNLPDIPSPPLQSYAFRKEVIARVNAGTPPEQIARDMHVQPETVEVIVEQYRRDGQVNLDTGGHGPMPAETRQKAEALLRDGWTSRNIARRLGISEFTARRIKQDANLPDIPSPPLQSIAFRKEVVTRVNAGTPPEQIARDMHVQPETVEVIVEQYRRDGQVNLDSGGHGPIPAETRQKAEALLRDGWAPTAVARRLDMALTTARNIKRRMNLADIGTPLHSPQIRKDVIARLQAGTPPARIAQDMHLQPETVELIDQENRRDRLAVNVFHMQAAQPEAGAGQPPVPTGPRGPGSPPPGTSTGGETYPPSKRQRVGAPPPTYEETMTPEVLKQLADDISPEQIAQNLNVEPDVVNRLIDQYVLGEVQKDHQAFQTEQAGQPAAAADAPPVPPEVRQEVIRQLNEGHMSADIANSVHLTVFQVDQIRDQYLQEALADFDPDLLEQ